ncbi:MAG: hypothetical protein OHK0052_04600 [Anaerolineales bacterium]
MLIFLSIALPWLGALLVWLTGDRRPKLQHALAVTFAVAAGITALLLLAFVDSKPAIYIQLPAAFGALRFTPDGLGVSLAAIATVIGSLAVIFSVDYMQHEAQLGRYYTFVLLFIGSMVGLVLTADLLWLFFFWEMTALCSYALISFYNDDPKAVAGGMKALIITQVGGVGLLAGALIAKGYLGTFEIAAFLQAPAQIPAGMLAVAGFSFLAAAAAKSAQFPFQTWLPDAMEAPTPVSALIHAATMVNAGVYLLARFYPAFESVPGWTLAVTLVGMVTALMAAVMAMTATDLKRTLAYSTVSQLGYMVYAVGVGGVFAAQFHLLSHAVFKALLFLAAGAVIHSVGTRDMRKMGALGKDIPFVRNTFIIGALALAGLPILNGFWSKELILEAGLKHGALWAYAGMLLGAGLTAFYSFRMVWMVFYGEAAEAERHLHPAGAAMRLALGVLAVGTLTTWLLGGSLGHLLSESLPYHEMHTPALGELLAEVLLAPATYGAMAVVALGLLAWWGRARLRGLAAALKTPATWAQNSFGFEWINRQVVQGTQNAAGALRALQTGQLNWNILAIIGGLTAILLILVLGA